MVAINQERPPLWDHPVVNDVMRDIVMDTTIHEDRDAEKILAGRSDLLSFIEYTFPQYKADAFHRDVANHLNDVAVIDPETGKRKIKNLMLFSPPQHGKLISHDVPVLTAHGWKTHGELRTGDHVFGLDGRLVEILAISKDDYCTMEVEFTDGTKIPCHPKHEWPVYDRTKHSAYRNDLFTYETEYMFDAGVWYGKRDTRGGRAKYQIASPKIDGREKSLPLPPYVLGVWLGDGSTANTSITHHPDDEAIIEKIERLGIKRTSISVHAGTGVHTDQFKSLHSLLVSTGLLGNKHIPDAYFTASASQRLELLAGLMDSDGYIYHENGRATFSNTDPILIRDVSRLIATFGWRVTKSWTNPQTSTSGIVGKKAVCQITFNPDVPIPTALERKNGHPTKPARRRRAIKNIEKIAPIPGRCIQVEGGIYLVGDTQIPTHNSELVSTRLPGFWLPNNPDLPVALVSYGASLAFRNSRYARSVVESPLYGHIFPEIERDTQNWRMSDWHIKNGKGYVLAVGVGGPITGHGFGLGIIDDPIENWAAAQSEALRERVWQWWLGTFKTRMWEGGSIVFIMTRWHEDDLAGRILRQEGRVEEGGKWTVISYPALADHEEGKDRLGREPGEPLAPSRYSRDYLMDLRDDLGPNVWSAEYQQKPTKPEGDIFKIGRIQIVESVPANIAEVELPEPTERRPEPFPILKQVFMGTRAWDLAGSEKKMQKQDPDFTVGFLVAFHEGSTYLLDMVRGQMSPDQVEDTILMTAKMDGRAVRVRIEQEPGQSGKAQVQRFIKLLAGYDVDGVSASGDKVVRANPLASQVNAGNVFTLRAPWNKYAINELAGFPNAAHDDVPDAAAYAFNDQTTGETWARISFKKI